MVQEDQVKTLVKLIEQQIQLLQSINSKLDQIAQSIKELISSKIKYL